PERAPAPSAALRVRARFAHGPRAPKPTRHRGWAAPARHALPRIPHYSSRRTRVAASADARLSGHGPTPNRSRRRLARGRRRSRGAWPEAHTTLGARGGQVGVGTTDALRPDPPREPGKISLASPCAGCEPGATR